MPRKVFAVNEILTASDVNEYFMDQAVMTFAGTAARGSAIGTAVEGMVTYLEDSDSFEYWDGSAWDELTLPVSTTSPVSGDSLVYDGTNWVNGPRSGNAIINGDFGVWQRGTSFSFANNKYSADRWRLGIGGPLDTTTATVSRQSFSPADIEAIGYGDAEYFYRSTITTVGSMNTAGHQTRLEDVGLFAGQIVTFSFWAKADSARSVSALVIQDFGSGGSSSVVLVNEAVSITTSWVRYSLTFTVPSVSGKTIGSDSFFRVTFRQELEDGSVLDIWGVQLEAGPVATPFTLAGGGSKAAELALCQRYYYMHAKGTDDELIGVGQMETSTAVVGFVQLPTTMRTVPSVESATGTDYYRFRRNGANDQFNSISLISSNSTIAGIVNSTDVSGTGGDAGRIFIINAAGYLAFDAEL